MLISSLLATATAPLEWSSNMGIIMIIANIFAIAVGKFTIERPHSKPELPAPQLFWWFWFTCGTSNCFLWAYFGSRYYFRTTQYW